MPDINKVLFKNEKRMVKKWIANKIKASILRRDVRMFSKQKRAIENKLSKKVAKVEELTTLIHADDHRVRLIGQRRRKTLDGLIRMTASSTSTRRSRKEPSVRPIRQ